MWQEQLQITNPISIKKLFFKYEKEFVLEDINLEVKDKDFLTILGPNGGGKSTLLKLIFGINPLNQGDIKIFGNKIASEIPYIGYVPQNTNINLNFPISVIEVVMMGQNDIKKRFFGYKKEEKIKALEVLEKVNMKEFASSKISNLSGGQRQRVLIARALFCNPKILLLDEPTSNIDISGCEQIYQTLENLNKEITIVVISHDISVVLKHATKAVYINKRLTYHDLSKMKDDFKNMSPHVCEIELLEMLGKCKC
ncbi:ATP-binding cassette domain-containing protein [Poseidonibacter ostreae]|uniref:ATP-binding cassette domain-containing protein n=1 Tax=Poseidonibacter ostreae TaxID=2654171 RepID=A0A6L4WVQ5_9BACT|nr:ATP-binding cassette domain-containing protein [Poseidonibacter ostreae]KAB7892364.1 ATP-binding cassette domain-containing protein [Poseidonibacter ostreae]